MTMHIWEKKLTLPIISIKLEKVIDRKTETEISYDNREPYTYG